MNPTWIESRVLHRFDRVEIVFRQRVQAGRRGAERVEQCHLDQVVALRAGGDEAARFRHIHAHRWRSDAARIDAARIVREAPAHQIDDLRIQLYRIDLPGAVIVGLQHVRADGYHGWDEHAPFDAILVTAAASHIPPPLDADKSNYDHYYERCLALIRSGGLIALDNMLWGGAVTRSATDADTAALQALNAKLQRDQRIDHALLTVGDGLALARKR